MLKPALFHDATECRLVPPCLALCGILAWATSLPAAPGSPLSLGAHVESVTVPPGGTAQIQISLDTTKTIISGEVIMDLDPTVFGEVIAVDVFSATGDQVGAGDIQGRHLDAHFSSQTGGIGRMAGVPFLVVSVPVLASATPGKTSPLTFHAGSTSWRDTQHVQYSVVGVPGTLTVGGSLSVQDVVPGGGMLPAGSVVKIDGTGFTDHTTVAVDGVSIASTQFVSPQEIDLTLGAAADLTAKRVLVQNPDHSQTAFFSSLRGSFVHRPASGPLTTIQPIFPLLLYSAGNAGTFVVSDAGVSLENPHKDPVDVIIDSVATLTNGSRIMRTKVTLPPGAIYLESGQKLGGGLYGRASLQIFPTAPIRMAVAGPAAGTLVTPMSSTPGPTTQLSIALDGTTQFFNNTTAVTWNWAAGTKPPPQKTLAVLYYDAVTPFSASASTASGGQWLSVSPAQGIACLIDYVSPANCPSVSKVTVTVDASQLSPGVYNGTLTFMPSGYNPRSTVIPVVFRVDSQPLVFVDQTSFLFSKQPGDTAEPSRLVNVTSNADPLPLSVIASTQSGQGWLSVTPDHASTPATLTISVNPAALSGSKDTGTIVITGPGNTQTIAVLFQIVEPPPPRVLTPFPVTLRFSVQAGQPPPASQVIFVPPIFDPFTTSSETNDGGTWLTSVVRNGPGVPAVTVSVDPAVLPAGTYNGTVTIVSPLATGPAHVPITLTIWSGTPPQVAVDPAKLSFTAVADNAGAYQPVNVSTGDLPVEFSWSVSTDDGDAWLRADIATSGPLLPPFAPRITPATVNVITSVANLTPGTYTGHVTVMAPPGSSNSATIQVTLIVAPAPPPPPQQSAIAIAPAIVNAASQIPGSLAPGEIITLFGQNIGPRTPAGFGLGPDGKVATNLGGTQVLFDGFAAPVLYACATQVNAIVPYEVDAKTFTNISLQFNGTTIPAGAVSVASSAPAIFMLDEGPAVLNEDNSINNSLNPALRGSRIQIYATGEGATSPPGITGEINGGDTRKPVLPVTVTIGGVDAQITYYGSAPSQVSGLFQVNAVVPPDAVPGPALPLVLKVGTLQSQNSVTIAVK